MTDMIAVYRVCTYSKPILSNPLQKKKKEKKRREEPLFLQIKRSQVMRLGHLFRMALGHLPREMFPACPSGREPRGKPRTGPCDKITWLALILPERLREQSGCFCSYYCPHDPAQDKWRKWMDGTN